MTHFISNGSFDKMSDREFARTAVVGQILVLVDEERPSRRQLRRDIYDYFPDTRPKVVFDAVNDAVRRDMLVSANGILEITQKGKQYRP